jgi:hypothetical protein
VDKRAGFVDERACSVVQQALFVDGRAGFVDEQACSVIQQALFVDKRIRLTVAHEALSGSLAHDLPHQDTFHPKR